MHHRSGHATLLATFACAIAASLTLAGPARADGGGGPTAQPTGPGPVAAPVLGDVNRDCVVDTLDLVALISAWGTAAPAADLDGNGVVEDQDQQILLAAWGSTCGRRLLGDVNGDGIVTTTDLARLLGDWGANKPRSDLNDDGVVGQADLDVLLANWGRTLGRRLLGDFNGDDVVDVRDLTAVILGWNGAFPGVPSFGEGNAGPLELQVILARWGATSGTDLTGDVNGDKLVDSRDSDLVLGFWGTGWAPGDLDRNGTVGQSDLVIVLGQFGRTASDDLAGDVNGDWVVDGVDSAIVEAFWGSDDPRADLNGDGTVGVLDLTVVLASFGDTFGRQLLGDVDGSCAVDGRDIALIEAFWNTSFEPTDLDADGTVGFLDLTIALGGWGETCP